MHLDEIAGKVAERINPERACQFAASVNDFDRWFTSSAFTRSSQWIVERLREAGCVEAEVVELPADGRTRMQDWTMPLAWDCDFAELRIVEPIEQVLCSREMEPRCVAQWSAGTDGWVTAELHLLEEDKPYPKGAFVLTDRHPQSIIKMARETMPAAFITDYVRQGYPEHRTMWINALAEDGGWGVRAGQISAPVFVIPPAVGRKLRDLLKKGPVRLTGRIDANLAPGIMPIATAVTPGRSRDAEIVVMAHGYESGVIDNASGVAACIEAATVLGELIRAGVIDQPQRSIRWLIVSECYGTVGLYTIRPELARRGLAGLYLDTVGDRSREDYPFKLHRVGAASPTFVNGLVKLILQRLPEKWKRDYHWRYENELPLADHMISDPMVNIPTPWLGRAQEFPAWHCSDDRPELLDEVSMASASFLAAAFAYFAASAGDDEAAWLAENLLPVLEEELADRAGPDEPERRAFWQWALRRAAKTAANLARSAAGREKALEAAERFAGSDEFQPAPAELEDPRAASVVPVRRVWGTLTFESLPPERRAFGSPRWSERINAAWFWADGKRTVSQIATLVSLELGGSPQKNLIQLFDLAAEAGLCDLKEV